MTQIQLSPERKQELLKMCQSNYDYCIQLYEKARIKEFQKLTKTIQVQRQSVQDSAFKAVVAKTTTTKSIEQCADILKSGYLQPKDSPLNITSIETYQLDDNNFIYNLKASGKMMGKIQQVSSFTKHIDGEKITFASKTLNVPELNDQERKQPDLNCQIYILQQQQSNTEIIHYHHMNIPGAPAIFINGAIKKRGHVLDLFE